MKIDINDWVKVKLTEEGERINGLSHERYPLKTDAEGFTRYQLWDLMLIFGPHLNMTCKVPFEDNLIYIKGSELPELEKAIKRVEKTRQKVIDYDYYEELIKMKDKHIEDLCGVIKILTSLIE